MTSIRHKFIVFEGLDGSGTSTQAKLLEQRLIGARARVVLTSEPSSGPIGSLIRLAFKGRLRFQSDSALFDLQMAHLFAADRHDHLYNDVDGVVQMVQRGHWVISTRYYFSSFAYHTRDESSWALVERLNCGFPKPDLMIYLDNPVEESMRRLEARPTRDSYENEEKLLRVAQNYRRVVEDYEGDKLILDATANPSEIHARIASHLGIVDAK